MINEKTRLPGGGLFEIVVDTDPEYSYVQGRNGSALIPRMVVREFAGCVSILGIGRRGKIIRGGLYVSAKCFEEVCRQYLNAARGYVIETRAEFSADDCQINEEGFCQTHQKVHLRETAAAMEVPDGASVTKEWDMRCPQCCSDEAIEIRASIWVRLHAGGTTTDDTFDGSHEWGSEDPAQCRRCDFSGTVGDFQLADDESRSSGRNEGSE